MAGEWNFSTFKEYIDSRLIGNRERHDAEVEAIRTAVTIARDEMERRLAELNQLRREVTQDRELFVRREIYDPTIKELTKEVNSLADKHIEMTAGQAANTEAITALKNSLNWLARLIVGAVILAIIAFGFRAMTGR